MLYCIEFADGKIGSYLKDHRKSLGVDKLLPTPTLLVGVGKTFESVC